MKKIIKSLLLLCVFIMVASIGVYASATYGSYGIDFSSAAYQSNINPYTAIGYNGSSSDGSDGECTWFAWGRAYEKLGIALPFTGNAKDWTANAAAVGYSTGTDARANSIMVEHYEPYGHVFFVEKVENGFAYVTEGNYSGAYHEDVINLSTMTRNGWTTAMSYVDYIYLGEAPEPVIPSDVIVSTNKSSYLPGETIIISVSAENMNWYTLSILDKSGNTVYENYDQNASPIYVSLGAGEYTAIASACKTWENYADGQCSFTVSEPTVSFTPNSAYTSIEETNATLGMTLSVSGGTVSYVGINIYDGSGKCVATGGESNDYVGIYYFDLNKEIGYTLTPGASYSYRFFATVNGKDYYSDAQPFNAKYNGTVIANGLCGDNLTWTLDSDGILKISGTGDMYDYELGGDVSGHMGSSAPWNRFYDSIHTVYINQNVTSIGDYAFTGCSVSDVTISESVLSIGAEAFEYCYLTNVLIPGKIGEIGAGAFLWCQSLTDINVSADNTHFCSIDGVLFNKDATEIIAFPTARTGSYSIPETVKAIGEYSFAGTCLTGVTVPESVTEIGARAFMYSQLASVVIPNGVTEIPDYLFTGCSQLESVAIPESVKSIGLSAFNLSRYGKSFDVYYGGTEAQWNTLKASMGSYNDWLQDATVHFTEADPLKDFSVTIPSTMVSNVNIVAPAGGWVIGENTFSASADKVCVLAVSYDGGQTYTRLTATANGDGTYSFDVNIADENTVVACSIFGDSNGDGDLSSGDVSRLNAGILHKVDMSPLSILACDVNGDGELSSGDISRLNAAILNKVKLSW